MKDRLVLKIDMPADNPFTVDESLIFKNIDKSKYKLISVHYSDSFLFVEYESIVSPAPLSGFVKR